MRRDVIAIGCSAGGLDALTRVLATMPQELGAAIAIVQHIAASESHLAQILQRGTPLRVGWARQGERVEDGRVYVAPPGLHLTFVDGHVQVDAGPRERHARPSIDRLFRSAAAHYASRAIGVVLTGNLDDGVAGLAAIRAAGGLAFVQDPRDAEFPELPRAAISRVGADYVLPADRMGRALAAATREVTAAVVTSPALHELVARSPLACPACGAVLREIGAPGMRRFRCAAGHAFTSGELVTRTSDEIETALRMAIRALHERATILETLARDAELLGADRAAADYATLVAETRARADRAHQLVTEMIDQRDAIDATSSSASHRRAARSNS